MYPWIRKLLSLPPEPLAYRQGDVLLLQVPELPVSAAKVTWTERIVLAFGEVTGHAHAIHETHVEAFELDGQLYLRIEEAPATLRHEEHAPITIAPGRYEVRRQREYAPAPRGTPRASSVLEAWETQRMVED